jgi:hypothetical protein
MTDQRELDRLLDAFFVEGTNELADRVIDAALDQIDQTQQRRVLHTPRRFSTMNMPTRLAAAAVIGVLAVGATLLVISPGQTAVGPLGPTPGMSSGASQTASPSADPSPLVVSPRAPAWTSGGNMTKARDRHTATLLQDGKVLVAGGFLPYNGGFIGSAELFDPGTGTWTATGSMVHPRGGTATLLQDGKVLVVGWDGGDAPKSAELYDPGSGTWTATENMIGARPGGNTATLLRDGKVLVTGAVIGDDQVASAELYDPGSGRWTAARRMIAVQSEGSATLLADGKVLVVGFRYVGVGDGERTVAASELYDPDSGKWITTGKMRQARDEFTATLLQDGKVLVAGGRNSRGDALTSAELYDPGSGTWTATGNMIGARASHTATLLQDGKVLVAGGGAGETPASAELYDPLTGTWSATESMIHARAGTATLLRDGTVLVTGGTRFDDTLASSELYDPGTGN